jgi:transcriptional regulator with XRE-family HTH domain
MAGHGRNSIYSTEYKRFLGRLQEARRATGITQIEAAKRLKRPQSYISRCESGQKRIDLFEMQDICRLYRKPLNFFVNFGV